MPHDMTWISSQTPPVKAILLSVDRGLEQTTLLTVWVFFSVQQHIAYMLSTLYAIARPSLTRVNPTKTVKVRIMKFSPYGSPIPVVFAGQVSTRNSKGFPEQGRQTREGGKTSHFLALNVNISKMVGDTSKVTINDFRLTPRWMTLNCYKVKLCRNFAWFCDFGRQQRLNEWR